MVLVVNGFTARAQDISAVVGLHVQFMKQSILSKPLVDIENCGLISINLISFQFMHVHATINPVDMASKPNSSPWPLTSMTKSVGMGEPLAMTLSGLVIATLLVHHPIPNYYTITGQYDEIWLLWHIKWLVMNSVHGC